MYVNSPQFRNMISSATNSASLPFPRTGKRGVPQQFPRRLFEMLNKETRCVEERPRYPKVISWSLSGKAFRIYNVADFASAILPKYFRTTKFSSFQRNLNLYGFTKVRRGADTDMYAHPSFLKDYPDLLVELRKTSGTTCSSPLRRNCFVTELMMMPSSTPMALEPPTMNNFKGVTRSVSPTLSHFDEKRSSSLISSPINDKSNSTISFTASKVDAINGDQVGHEYQRRQMQKEQRMHGHQLHQSSHIVFPSLSTSQNLNCIPYDNEHYSVQTTIKQARSSSTDRGKLDLLAMALEYECFASALASAN